MFNSEGIIGWAIIALAMIFSALGFNTWLVAVLAGVGLAAFAVTELWRYVAYVVVLLLICLGGLTGNRLDRKGKSQ